MKKILLSVFTVAAVAAVAVGATKAFFSDTETSTGNTFVAGALDLKVDNTSYGFDWNDPNNHEPLGVWGPNQFNTWTLGDLNNCGTNHDQTCLFFSFADLKPGDYGEDTISLHVQNDSWACMSMKLTEKPENNVLNPETLAGDTVANGNQDGELQNYLSFAFWKDDGDNVYEVGEGPLLFNGLASALDGKWETLADSSLNPATPLPATLQGTSAYVGKVWCFGTLTPNPVNRSLDNNSTPTETTTGFNCSGADPLTGPGHNIAQTDGIKVDVSFYAVQARHNTTFTCASMNPQ